MSSAASSLKFMSHIPALVRRAVKIAFAPKYLLYTNVVISTTSSGLGDVLEQSYEILTGSLKEWNRTRTRNMMYSGITVGIVCHHYYNLLDKHFPGRTVKTVGKKIIVDQFTCSPLTIVTLLVTLAILERKRMQDFVDDLKEKGKYLYAAEWVIWPPAQFVNFYFPQEENSYANHDIITQIFLINRRIFI